MTIFFLNCCFSLAPLPTESNPFHAYCDCIASIRAHHSASTAVCGLVTQTSGTLFSGSVFFPFKIIPSFNGFPSDFRELTLSHLETAKTTCLSFIRLFWSVPAFNLGEEKLFTADIV